MPFPKDSTALKSAGYKFDNDAVCRGCGEDIEWWISSRGNKVAMNPMPSGSSPAIMHRSVCSDPYDGGK